MSEKSSRRWLKEHFSDVYVKRAQQAGFRSRAAYKLLELQERDHLFKPNMVVIELGAAPGGWSQVIAKYIKPAGRLIALDLLPMEPIEGVEFIQADFTNNQILEDLSTKLLTQKADWVISDMASNRSGNESIDVPRAIYLAELALDFSLKVIHEKGGFLVKVLQGVGFDAFLNEIKSHFKHVMIRKPKASRGRSRELYIVARELKKE